jgi:monovalent cation/hydrogen antiporter
MNLLEWILLLLLGAVILAALARRIHAPSPALLALGGAFLALLPHGPRLTLDPALALALFVAPVLLDAAWESSLRELRDNWVPVAGMVFIAVAVTTIGVALVARWLVPEMSWAVAITLGALVSPPDAAAATAVLREVTLPHRTLVILEGESLLNDASALFIYRIAIGAVMLAHRSTPAELASTLVIDVAGSVGVGIIAAFAFSEFISRFSDPPSSIVLQFLGTFGVWIIADRLNLSGVLTMVAFAMVISRRASIRMPAAVRVPSFAVWDTAVFVLNALAFVLVGLQVRPILDRINPAQRVHAVVFALAVLATVIVARALWLTVYTAAVRSSNRIMGNRLWWPIPTASINRIVVVAWCGMRGTVTLAAALALPDGSHGAAFPYRDLIVLTAFAVVLGTLVIQGLTLLPLVMLLGLHDEENTLEREAQMGRREMFKAALLSVGDGDTQPAMALRREYTEMLAYFAGSAAEQSQAYHEQVRIRAGALGAARARLTELRNEGHIGDEAFHLLEAEFDLIELGAEIRGRW